MMRSRTQRSAHVTVRVSPSTASRTTTPTSKTAPPLDPMHPVERRATTENSGTEAGTADDRRHLWSRRTGRQRRVVGDVGELEIVDSGERHAMDVDHLPVEQMQPGVVHGLIFVRVRWIREPHCPPPVMIMSGMAATETTRMITR
jgi:hypothetical protein